MRVAFPRLPAASVPAALAMVALLAAPVGAVETSAWASGDHERSGATSAQLGAARGAELAAALDVLPIVVDAPSSTAGGEAIGAYRRATLANPDPAGEMFARSFDSLEVAEADVPAIDALNALFVEDPESLASSSGRATLTPALAAIDDEPGNAARLSNVAVAAWLYGVANAVDSGDSYNWHLQQAAATVLAETNERFPGNRAVLLNLAFLLTVVPGWDFSGEPYAQEALELDPGDVTARALLASIQSRRADAVDGVDRALETLGPILEDPSSAALGHALAGDAHLAGAFVRRAEAPASSRHHAALALAAYDRGLELAADAGLHAGRAKALERLDDLAGAVAAQEAAVELAPESLDMLVELARLRHRAGDAEGLRAATTEAIAEVSNGWDPPLAGARFVTTPLDDAMPDDRGFLGWSIGSDRDHVPVAPRSDTGTGAGVVVVATVPREPPGVDLELSSRLAARSAWQLGFAGAVLAGDASEAASLDAAWTRDVPWDASWDSHVAAARLAAGTAPAQADGRPPGLAFAETALQRAEAYDRAAELCRRLGDLRCSGENRYHAEDAAAALQELLAAHDATLTDDDEDGPGPELRMLVAAAAEQAGDLATAERFLATTAAADDSGSWRVVAAMRAGDLRLDARDAGAAIAWYDLALAAIEANGLAESTDYHRDLATALDFRGLRQVVRNNRAVALLRSLPARPDGAPTCNEGFAFERCEAALADIRAAISSDPKNAVYRMNEGWATRLLGRADEARAALEEAVRLDATLYPAFNDLGILLALGGDPAGARAAFEAAIAAEPTYDLARWNLGILALRDAPGGVAEGQALLAEAIDRDPELRTAPLEFRSDEETYRFGFEAPLPPSRGGTVGLTYSVGAVVLAATASIAALGQIGSTLFGHGVQTAIGSTQGRLERLSRARGWRARQRALRRRLPAGTRGWLSWLGIAALLVVITGWQAAQASPTTVGSSVLLAIIATLLGLVAHGAGHLVAARAMGGRIIPATWGPGAVVALLFLPVQAATGPFLAERMRRATGGRGGAWKFHLGGPLANAVVGVTAYALFLVEPLPVLRLVAQVQLAAIGYTLLPIRPLDGWALKQEHPRLLLALGFGVVAAGSAFATGLL